MKLVPAAVSRKIAEQGFLASENAPKVLFVGGVVGMVGSTVLACRATLKLSDTLQKTREELDEVRDIPDEEYEANGESRKKDIAVITLKGYGDVARLYAPSVLLGGASIFALTKSHNLLQERNLALTAAYAAVDGAFTRYRERVVDRYGEEVDREMMYETERVDIVDEETGEIVSTEVITDAPGSRYARWYDSESSNNWSRDPEINRLFLRSVQQHMNDRLHSRGHVWLNEVFSELGMKHTNAGAIVGWRYKKDSGDDFIDFGCWEGMRDGFDDCFNGRDGAILLDFNVDGPIYGKIKEEGLE